ncbi:protein-disulfide reductase DsbD domain-containing protein [Mucilaginibacter sp. dw_454]|uniref:protein-disulfide reductase DsbD domain-containing protein n=1 Tax=Mucilaginibacter sp. dw_454 TaxID=2720079 RepID=UPI0021021937|nr:protein-disulfide reductase DsbD domain-containing protein [Mucilaginibacter sp. dw_454]
MIISSGLYAQIENPVKWSYAAKKMNQQEAVVFIKATIDENWHIYSINQKPGGPLKTSLVFIPSTGYQLEGKLREPTPHTVHDEVFDMEVSYFEKSVVFQQKVKLNTGQAVVKGKIKYMVCNEEKCVTPDDVDFSIPVK